MQSPFTGSLAESPAALLCFGLGRLRLALPLTAVERVLPAAEATPLPGAPTDVLGVLNLAGEVMPVLDLRPRFRQHAAPIDPLQQLLVVRCRARRLALLIDDAEAVIEYPLHDELPAKAVLPQAQIVSGLLRLSDGLLLIANPEAVLSLDDAPQLERALAQENGDAR